MHCICANPSSQISKEEAPILVIMKKVYDKPSPLWPAGPQSQSDKLSLIYC